MSGMPRNGSAEMIMARALTNSALAVRISMLQGNRRAFDKDTADAILAEAERRLMWADAYAAHTTEAAGTPEVRLTGSEPIPTVDRIAVMRAIDDFVSMANAHPTKPFGYTYYADEPGKRFTRIVMGTPNRSVHCFIDNATGDLLKAAGWKAPAKGIRGNIVTGMDDVAARFDWSGHYLYIR